MENVQRKKPRTIQMKYPAPYSQSWTETEEVKRPADKSRIHAEASRHCRPRSDQWAKERVKRIKMKSHSPRRSPQVGIHPLPFSKFGLPADRKMPLSKNVGPLRRQRNDGMWMEGSQYSSVSANPSEENAAVLFVRHPPASSTRSSDSPRGGCCRRAHCRDPTAPHLKYGLFPKRNFNKLQSPFPGAEAKSRASTERSCRGIKTKTQKGVSRESPSVVVVRGGCRAQLSVSPPAHLDIRPSHRARPPDHL